MNIVVMSHRLPFPPNKGEKIRTYNQLEYFRQAGLKVNLFCLIDSEEELSYVDEYEKETGFSIVAVKPRFRKFLMLLGLFSGRALSVSNFYNQKLQDKLDEYATKNQVDSFYCTSSAMAEYKFKAGTWVTNSRSSRRDLVDFMDLDSDKWQQYRQISRFPMSLVYWYEEISLARYERKIQKHFDECIFISRNETELFSKKFSKPVGNLKVIGNGVDLAQFRLVDKRVKVESKTLLFSGVMDYLPNENAMLWFSRNVWPTIKKENTNLRLIIAGMNPSDAIVKLAEDELVTVTGYVDDMVKHYQEASVFIAPFQIARGVQNKVLQAFACGLPVVTTSIGAEGIECEHEKHCLIADSAESFASQVSLLLKDEKCYGRIADNAEKLVCSRYTWEASNRQLLELFKSRN